MITLLKHWSAAPIFVGEEDKTYRASLINSILLQVSS